MVMQGYPDTRFGDQDYLLAGHDTYLDPDGRIMRGLIYCDLSSVPSGQQIISATLQLYHLLAYDVPNTTMRIRTHRALEAWSETDVNWRNRPDYGEAYGAAFVRHGARQTYDFDVTALAQAWHEGQYPNYGIVLRGIETTNAGWRGFSSREHSEASQHPRLVIQSVPAGSPAPQVDRITPDHGARGETVDVTIEGNSFYTPTAWLDRAGQGEIPIPLTTFTRTHISGRVALPNDAALGRWDVVVENQDGQDDTLSGGFTVQRAPPPQVDRITPNSGVPGETVNVVLEGAGYNGPQAYIERNRRPVAVTIVVSDSSRITGTLNLPANAALGAWDVWVWNEDGQFDTLSGGFTVQAEPGLRVEQITPDHGSPGETVEVVIEGRGFDDPQAWIERDQIPLDVSIVISTTSHITGTLDLPGDAPLGDWDVWVWNEGGQFDALYGGFTVQIIESDHTVYLPIVYKNH
jgi:hypothetical protein